MNSVMFAGLFAEPPTLHTTLLQGVQIRYGAVRAQASSHDCVTAFRTYQQAKTRPAATMLVVPGAFESAELSHPLAFWLAEQGLRVTLMNLGEHGSADWYSYDGGAVEALHLDDYLRQVQLVLQREITGESLILAGSGLGGVLAQLAAGSHPQVMALALFGAPLPEQAGETWPKSPPSRRGFWRWSAKRGPSASLPVAPPSRHHLRGPWLPLTASDREVFAVWRLLGTETPHLATEYARLAGQTRPAALPALVCVGADDPFITPRTAWTTAQGYQTEPTIVPQAAHWLLAGPAWLFSARLLLDFNGRLAQTPTRVAVTKGPHHA